MQFDRIIDRHGTHSYKWDMMQTLYGIPPDRGLAMWVADMDFPPPASVQAAVQRMADHGIYGYFGDDRAYRAAIVWWMQTRHGWAIQPEWILSTHGLVNGVAMAVDTWSQPGDGVVLMTPVYHAFSRVILGNGRQVVECQLAQQDGRYVPDFAAWDAQMTGRERIFVLCSPHNPGGRVWTRDELQGVADFCRRHDLVLISDEIHHDLVMPGHRHIPMSLAAPDVTDRLVMMTSTTKSFNIAGAHTGNVIIEDPALRQAYAGRMNALGISPNAFGLHMATAAYTPEGAAWLDALMPYLNANRALFDQGIAAIPGVRSMRLEGTYLAWVDFGGTGMSAAELKARIESRAGIAANNGPTFGAGGEGWMRFNIATPRARIAEAVERLQQAFSDLQ